MPETLVRTDSGLANQHLFFGVDLVVYTEGGGEWSSVDEALARGSDETPDAAFWRTLFSTLRPNVLVHVKSVGGRTVALEIARRVEEAGVGSVCVCTDADLDGFPPETVAYAAHIKTWGYSWESDLADLDVLRCVFVRLRGHSIKAQQVLADLEQWRNSFKESCGGYVHQDVRRVRAGACGVFERDKLMRNLTLGAGANVTLDEGLLQQRANDPLPEGCVLPEIDEASIVVDRHCLGKLLLRASYHATLHFIQRVRRGRIDFDTFVDLALSCFAEALIPAGEKRDYYDGALPAF